MRRRTVKSGLKLLIGGVVCVILATFFHHEIATILLISPGGEDRFIYLGLLWGGIFGFSGILVTVLGFLRAPAPDSGENLLPVLSLLTLLVLLFLALLVFSLKAPEQPRLRPGETITI